MTDMARVTLIEPDPFLAESRLQQARPFVDDGRREENSEASRLVLLHSAVIAICDAALAMAGKRVEGSVGGHQLRLAEAEAVLDELPSQLFERLDEARATRNEVSYRALASPAPRSAAEIVGDVDRLLKAVARRVTSQLPPWSQE